MGRSSQVCRVHLVVLNIPAKLCAPSLAGQLGAVLFFFTQHLSFWRKEDFVDSPRNEADPGHKLRTLMLAGSPEHD